MEYKARQLKTSDIFEMSRILQKLEVKISFEKKEVEDTVMEIIFKVAENLYKAEDEVSGFMGGLVGLTAEQYKELPIADSMKIIASFKGLKGVSNFFKLAGLSAKTR